MQLSWQDAELACPEALVRFPAVSIASIGVVSCNPRTWEAEAGSEAQGFGCIVSLEDNLGRMRPCFSKGMDFPIPFEALSCPFSPQAQQHDEMSTTGWVGRVSVLRYGFYNISRLLLRAG